jgi:putative membrane protein
MYAGVIALLHVADVTWTRGWEPGIALPLLLSAGLYAVGVRRLWSLGVSRGVRGLGVACFVAGWLVLALALSPALHEASDELFTAHMVQHELMMVVAAPLLLLGRPALVMLWALPRAARRRVGAIPRADAVRSAWGLAVRPFDAWLIHGVAVWAWHIPSFFQATLHDDAIHALQHVSFFGSALLFWWAIIHPRRRAELGLSIIALFTTAVHTAVLGALMTFSRTPWYPSYASRAADWGLTPMADQQLAGLIMWVPASLAYLVAALIILRRWLRDSEVDVVRQERAAVRLLTISAGNVQ